MTGHATKGAFSHLITAACALALLCGPAAGLAVAQPASGASAESEDSGNAKTDRLLQEYSHPESATAHDKAELAVDAENGKAVKEGQATEHYSLAGFYFRKWDLPLAEAEFKVAIMNWPDFKAAHRDLCLVSLFRGEPLQALAELMMVLELGNPIPLNQNERNQLIEQTLTLHYNKGIEWGTRSKWKEAVAEFGWALSYDPDDVRIHRSLAFAYANLGNFEMAEKQYAASFALDPADPYAHADFANLLAEKGQQQRALSQMSQAVKLAPTTAALHVDLGWLAESHGDFSTAGQEFQRAVELSPRHAGLWTHLGRILEHEGKSQEAIAAYNKALALDPGREDARDRIARLRTQVHS